jgi:hypothetical protein
LLKQLTLRILEKDEFKQADELFEREHYLGPVKRSGKGLIQIIEYQGSAVALMDWGPAALKLIDRDQWIGWNGRQRADRRDLIVQNRRFLLLQSVRMPNLASRCLSMALKALPRALALDGKYVRDQVLTLCLSDHESGAPQAIALSDPKPRTEDNKTDGELTVSKKLYQNSELHDAVVTADALHDKQSIAQAIVEQGGDYLLQSKDPRRSPMKTAESLDKTPTPFFTQT